MAKTSMMKSIKIDEINLSASENSSYASDMSHEEREHYNNKALDFIVRLTESIDNPIELDELADEIEDIGKIQKDGRKSDITKNLSRYSTELHEWTKPNSENMEKIDANEHIQSSVNELQDAINTKFANDEKEKNAFLKIILKILSVFNLQKILKDKKEIEILNDDQAQNISAKLTRAAKQLKGENAAIEVYRPKIEKELISLNKEIYYASVLNKILDAASSDLKDKAPGQYEKIKKNIMEPLKDKFITLIEVHGVNIQFIQALTLLEAGNDVLIKGAERAKHTTIQALQVSQALRQLTEKQRVILEVFKDSEKNMEKAVENMKKAGFNAKMTEDEIQSSINKHGEMLKMLSDLKSSVEEIDHSTEETIKTLSKVTEDIPKNEADMVNKVRARRSKLSTDISPDELLLKEDNNKKLKI